VSDRPSFIPDARPPRGTAATSSGPPSAAVDESTGLYRPEVWRAIVAREDARWARYREPCVAVQLEIGAIDAVERRLGPVAAERLASVLAEVLHEETRASDLLARTSGWRIQGLLPEMRSDGVAAYEGRVRDGFGARIGRLPFGLLIGTAAPDGERGLRAALDEAGRSMRGTARAVGRREPSSEHSLVSSVAPASSAAPWPAGPPVGATASAMAPARPVAPSPEPRAEPRAEPSSPQARTETLPPRSPRQEALPPPPRPEPPTSPQAPAPPPPRRPGELRDAFISLEELYAYGLVTDDEYRMKRLELLGRL
jgi:hypothetical protein